MINFDQVINLGNIEQDFVGPINLYMIDQQGYGDVSLALKIANFLLKKYPKAVIRIVAEKNSFKKIEEIDPNFLKKNSMELIDRKDSTRLSKDFYEEAKLEIETAIFDNSLRYYSKPTTPRPQIFIGECGLYDKSPYKPPIICLSGNIGENYPGILIEPDLKQFSRLKPAEKAKARGQIIEEMKDTVLQKQILSGWNPPFSEFSKNNSFAFSYYNFPISYKRAAVVFAASNDQQHANYFVSASGTNNKNQTTYEMLSDENFRETLAKLGYSKIVFFTEDSESPKQTIVLNKLNAKGREFRIFHRNRFQQDLTIDLMRLSELCGVAGDQSLTEALSLGAVPIPEEWHCQIPIVDQIARTYYNHNIMASIYNNTWKKQRETDSDLWVKAGKAIQNNRDEVKTIITKIQEESNLYHALEYRLNFEFANELQTKITEYNSLFVDELTKYTLTLKKEKHLAFFIATEIAHYHAKYKPHEPLMLSKILQTIETNIGEKFSHIDSIANLAIKDQYVHLLRSNKSNNILKTIIQAPSGNTQLATKLEKLYQKLFANGEILCRDKKKPMK